MPPTRVLLLRHAETSHPHIVHGAESDVGLSERGHRQARLIAEHLAGHRPEVLISSGMRRALDTATPIARATGLTLRIEPELHERKMGPLSGISREDNHLLWLETLDRWRAGETDHAPPGTESFDAMRRRLLPLWDRLAAEHAGRTLVIVAHGVVCKVLLLSLLPGHSVRTCWDRIGPILNVAVHELVREEAEGPWCALRVNHLPEGVF